MSFTRLPQMDKKADPFSVFNQLIRSLTDKFNSLDSELSLTYLRKSNKVPTNSADTTGDKLGDFNYDSAYLYVVVDNAGTLEWRRATLSSF